MSFQGGSQLHKILIVDDDEATLELMRIRLSEAYEAICTRDPEQALGLALEHKPDAILLDLMMPKFSGFELCQSLRSLSYTSTIPIIAMALRVFVKGDCTSEEVRHPLLFGDGQGSVSFSVNA